MTHIKQILWLPYILLYIIIHVMSVFTIAFVWIVTFVSKFLCDTLEMIEQVLLTREDLESIHDEDE